MWTLALETSGLEGGVALLEDGVCVEERPLRLGAGHAQTLVPAIQQLLAAHRLAPRDCELVAVSRGPGSFTGLRVGIVCAKSLAYATGCAVSGVETLRVIAGNAPDDVARLHVVMNAQRDEQFHQLFERDPSGVWQASGAVVIVSSAEWIESLGPEDVVTGPQLAALEPRLAGRCRVLPALDRFPRAAEVGRLGRELLLAGAAGDFWTLEPFYLRKSAAEEKWDARAGQASSGSSSP